MAKKQEFTPEELEQQADALLAAARSGLTAADGAENTTDAAA